MIELLSQEVESYIEVHAESTLDMLIIFVRLAVVKVESLSLSVVRIAKIKVQNAL